jgi:N-methylhydantoinase B
VMRLLGPCGGGSGDPRERDPQDVLEDVLDGLVSERTAREAYGVAIAGGVIDEAETRRLRGS